MLTTKEAIEKRRSIRKFKPDPIPDEYLLSLVESARLAPSGCNAQPWRFKIVKETDLKNQLAQAAFGQTFIATAPVVIVCCADIGGYVNGAVSGAQDLGKLGAIDEKFVTIIEKRAHHLVTLPIQEIGPQIAFNVAIAIEHMVLRALDFGLGTCWIRLLEGPKVNRLFGWDESIFTVALLPIGFPAENPNSKKRMKAEILIL